MIAIYAFIVCNFSHLTLATTTATNWMSSSYSLFFYCNLYIFYVSISFGVFGAPFRVNSKWIIKSRNILRCAAHACCFVDLCTNATFYFSYFSLSRPLMENTFWCVCVCVPPNSKAFPSDRENHQHYDYYLLFWPSTNDERESERTGERGDKKKHQTAHTFHLLLCFGWKPKHVRRKCLRYVLVHIIKSQWRTGPPRALSSNSMDSA